MSDIIGADEVIADFERAAARIGPLSDLLTNGAAELVARRTRETVAVFSGRTKAAVEKTRLGSADYEVGGGKDGSLRRTELGGSRGAAQPALYPAADAEAPGWEKSLAEAAGDI